MPPRAVSLPASTPNFGFANVPGISIGVSNRTTLDFFGLPRTSRSWRYLPRSTLPRPATRTTPVSNGTFRAWMILAGRQVHAQVGPPAAGAGA
jgi:hypothetical protein